MQLRYYQLEAIQAVIKNIKEGVKKQLIALPTGSGKTVCFAELARLMQSNSKMLIIAHREELLEQAIDKVRHRVGNEVRIGLEKAEFKASPNDRIVVASIQSICRDNRLERYARDHFSIIVYDECHHIVSDTSRKVLDYFNYNLLVGFTATPFRSDNVDLASVFDSIVYQKTIEELIPDFLCRIKGYTIKSNADLTKVKIIAGDYVASQLAKVVNTEERNKLIIDAYQQICKGEKAVVFCADVAHSQIVAELFSGLGIPARALWGDMNGDDRKLYQRQFDSGEVKILTNCNILTEGWDCPSLINVIQARPTQSALVYIQQVGRCTRTFEGKEFCRVIDIVDNSQKHADKIINIGSLFGVGQFQPSGDDILEVAKEFRNVNRSYPGADLDNVETARQLELLKEQLKKERASFNEINLVNAKVPSEVAQHSNFAWMRSYNGEYRVSIGENESISILVNLLGKYDVVLSRPLTNIRGEFLKEKILVDVPAFSVAVKTADQWIKHNRPTAIGLVLANARWRAEPPTEKQMGLLEKLLLKAHIPMPDNLTKGTANALISQLIGR